MHVLFAILRLNFRKLWCLASRSFIFDYAFLFNHIDLELTSNFKSRKLWWRSPCWNCNQSPDYWSFRYMREQDPSWRPLHPQWLWRHTSDLCHQVKSQCADLGLKFSEIVRLKILKYCHIYWFWFPLINAKLVFAKPIRHLNLLFHSNCL